MPPRSHSRPRGQVIGTDRSTARLTAPAGVTYLDLDVTDDESVASVVKEVIDRFGRIINVSSLSGFVPSPFMALYVSTKYAVEGYSGSLDHEVRQYGVRVLLVEPGPINTPFGAHSMQADTPLPLYESGRRNYDEVLAKNTSNGDDPAVVAKVIAAAATDRNPKLRRTAGSTAATVNALHRVAPARIFDRIIRSFNRMPN